MTERAYAEQGPMRLVRRSSSLYRMPSAPQERGPPGLCEALRQVAGLFATVTVEVSSARHARSAIGNARLAAPVCLAAEGPRMSKKMDRKTARRSPPRHCWKNGR